MHISYSESQKLSMQTCVDMLVNLIQKTFLKAKAEEIADEDEVEFIQTICSCLLSLAIIEQEPYQLFNGLMEKVFAEEHFKIRAFEIASEKDCDPTNSALNAVVVCAAKIIIDMRLKGLIPQRNSPETNPQITKIEKNVEQICKDLLEDSLEVQHPFMQDLIDSCFSEEEDDLFFEVKYNEKAEKALKMLARKKELAKWA